MSKQKEELLLEALKKGDQRAFKKVYQDNRSKFLHFGKKYGLAEDDLLDVYQDAYVALYENIIEGKLKQLSSSLSTYIISIGKYKILDRIRKDQRTSNNETILELAHKNEDIIAYFDLEDNELNENQILLKKYFDQLGKKCQEILKLFYYQKYSIREIMDSGNYNSENVVKSQKSRCLKTLKELFNK